MADLKTHNGIEYTLDNSTMMISWKERELNHQIWIGAITINFFINRGIGEYRAERNNKDLLIAAGLSEQDAQENLEVTAIPEMSGKVSFPPDVPGVAELTANDRKRFITLVTEKHLGFVSYEKSGSDCVFVP